MYVYIYVYVFIDAWPSSGLRISEPRVPSSGPAGPLPACGCPALLLSCCLLCFCVFYLSLLFWYVEVCLYVYIYIYIYIYIQTHNSIYIYIYVFVYIICRYCVLCWCCFVAVLLFDMLSAKMFCIVPSLTDDPRRESMHCCLIC